MKDCARRFSAAPAVIVAFFVAGSGATLALQAPEAGRRFDELAFTDPATSLDVATTPTDSLPVGDHARARWEGFKAAHGQGWQVHLDRRSGAPLLAEGRGIPWTGMDQPSVSSLAGSLRAFMAGKRSLLLADDAELVLDDEASGQLIDNVWQIVFNREVAGIPVSGERYIFTIGHGNLVSFGSPRWSRIDASPIPSLTAEQAQERIATYMKLSGDDVVSVASGPELEFIPLRAAGFPGGHGLGRYAGPLGSGYASALVWRVSLRVEGEQGTWLARVDAHTGAIRTFEDNDKYARVKGGVYPISPDQICPDGCEQPNYSMPFADIAVGTATQTASTMGVFNCSPAGSTARTTLNGPYVRVLDNCGALSQPVTCNADLDLEFSAGTDCAVPAGSAAGNTHAARSSFYHLNRIAEHARTWLPTVAWLTQPLTDVVNSAAGTCNAVWSGNAVNFYRSGGGCNNTGEIAAVALHEWGHGMDQNDGGNFDNPSEAYADVSAFMTTHQSCLGRGFRQFSNCGGYGNTCLNCTGVRDLDWDKHVSHTPSTPAGFLATRCPGGSGPCGKEVHCESYVGAETLWDLAVRDLPASGLDANTAWNLADKLWYKSRLGSGGDAYNCSLPSSDGCSATSWFQKIRAVDDDDGNLANGTPHAAAIFAAFDRHKIACGTVSDASNQNSTICPVLTAPTLTAIPGSTSATIQLTWTPVPNATTYRVLRNDIGCHWSFTRMGTSPVTNMLDGNLANGMPMYYTVQALTANAACDGPLSNCQTATPQPFAGIIKVDAAVYGCSSVITVTMTDGNVGTPPTAALTSTSEGVAETVVLTRIAPGSTTYRGTITTTANPAGADGLLSVTNGDTISATYIDASDGGGGLNIPRVAQATTVCAATGVRPVADGTFGTAMKGSRADATGSAIDLTWDVSTCSSADHHVIYGDLAGVASAAVTGASCDLGTSGAASWTGVPEGNLWFVVVGDDNASIEGSWGLDGNGAERGSNGASLQCGLATRNNAGTCP